MILPRGIVFLSLKVHYDKCIKVYIFWKEMTQGIQPALQIPANISRFLDTLKMCFYLILPIMYTTGIRIKLFTW